MVAVRYVKFTVLRQVHSLLKSEFSTECDPVLPLSIFIIFYFPYGRSVAAYILFLVLPTFFFPLHIFFEKRVLKGKSKEKCEQ